METTRPPLASTSARPTTSSSGQSAPFTRISGATRRIKRSGVGSSNSTTQLTASSAASTSARSCSGISGRPGPFRCRTLRSVLMATTSASPSDRAASRLCTCPGCSRSKQPLVKTTVRVPVRRNRSSSSMSSSLLTTGTLAALRGRSGIALSSINVGDRCQTTATVLVPARGEPRGTAIVVHGLAGNRAVMVGLAAVLARAGWQVYVPDLAGHGNSQMRFGYEQAEQCLAQAITAIAGHSRNPGALLLVGHSLGGALVLRVGSAARASATIALSPAALVPPARFPPRLLIITGNLDLPWVRQNTRQLAAWLKNDSNQHNPGPCADRIEWVAPATHASVLFDPRVWKAVLQWSACAQPGMPAVADADSAGAAWLQAGTLLGSLGILLLFPLLFRLLGPPIKLQPKVSAPPVPTRRLLASWATAVGLVVCIVGLTGLNQHIRPVRLADGSWLAWVSGLTGGVLMLLLPACRVRE